MKSLTTAEKIEYLWQSNAPLTASLAGVLQHYSGYKPPRDNATSNISGDHGFTSALSEYSRRRKKLDALPPAEIDLLYAFARNVELNTEELQRPYNQTHAQADFSHWARFSRWTVDETVALLFGKNPKIVKERYLEKFKYDDELAELEKESLKIMSLAATGRRGFSRQYKELVALVERSEIFLPGTQDVDPVSALSWARHTGISIPAALAAAFVGKNARTVTWRTPATESSVDIPAASIRAATEDQATPVVPRSASCGDDGWKVKAQIMAGELIKRDKERDLYPSQINLADEIAKEFRRVAVLGADGKPLTGAYIKRHALKGISSAQGKQLSTAKSRGK